MFDTDDPLSLDFTSPGPVPQPLPSLPAMVPLAPPDLLPEPPRETAALTVSPLSLVPLEPPLSPHLPPVAVPPAPAPSRTSSPAPAVGKYPRTRVSDALRHAAMMHVAGRELDALRRLESALTDGEPLGDEPSRAWIAMFQLLEALGHRPAFDTLGTAYAERFHRPPPPWSAVADDQASAAGGAGGGVVELSGALDAKIIGGVANLMKAAATSQNVTIDITRLVDANNHGASLLLRAISDLRKQGKQVGFVGPAALADLLMAKIKPFDTDNEATWLLMLDAYQQAGQREAFEDAAATYAIAHKVKAPAYVAEPATAGTPTASGTPAPLLLSGQLRGVERAHFAAIEAVRGGGREVEINAYSLMRIDGKSIAALKPVLQSLNAAGHRVRINGLSQLVAAYLTLHGVWELADLRTR